MTQTISNYTGRGWQGAKYDRNLGITDIAKLVRAELKKIYPACNFSVTKQSYSGGSSMTVALMSAPFRAFVEGQESSGYHQVNQYYIEKDSRLTDDAKRFMTYAANICRSYNYDDSDAMIDYFDTNFYLHLAVGKWDKPFIKN